MFGLFSPRWTRSEIAFTIGFVALILLPGFAGDSGRDWLRYDRQLIGTGEIWRLLTGNFVHLSAGHLALDLAGLTLLLLFFRDVFSPRDWALATLAGCIAVGAGLWFFNPEVARYVGISGVLHTLLFAGLLLSFRHTPLINGVVFVAMAWRIWMEQQPGYDVDYMQNVIGGSVLVDAHFYGALASLPVVVVLWRRSQRRQTAFRHVSADSSADSSADIPGRRDP